jgi:serine/threonine protein phosphatase 1
MAHCMNGKSNSSTQSFPRPRLPEGVRIYAIGDVHGRANLLTQIFELIDADLEHFPPSRNLQVFLGDYVDRGTESRAVIDLLLERGCSHETIFLKGNHEAIMLDFLDRARGFGAWRSLGGAATMMSYGVAPNLGKLGNDIDLVRPLKLAMPTSHLRFLRNLKCSFTCGDYFFVHAGVRPGVPLEAQKEDDLLWIRNDFLDTSEYLGKFIVHGHTPVECPDIRSNRINIDTGAYATGNLTLLSIEKDRMLVLT